MIGIIPTYPTHLSVPTPSGPSINVIYELLTDGLIYIKDYLGVSTLVNGSGSSSLPNPYFNVIGESGAVDMSGYSYAKSIVITQGQYPITSLNVSGLVNLLNLDVSSIDILTLNAIGDILLKTVQISALQFATSVDFSNLPSLLTVYINSNALLQTVDLSGNILLYDISISSNPSLTSINLLGNSILSFIVLSNNALTEITVDYVLNTLDINGIINGSVYLAGGTNSAPSAAGLISKANLEGKGWVVNVIP